MNQDNAKGGMATLVAGLIAGLIVVVYATSYASLIFQGKLGAALPTGIGMLLMGAMLSGLVLSLISSMPGVVLAPQDVPAVVIALVATGLVGLPLTEAVATLQAAIMFSSLILGAAFYMLGRVHMGRMVRFLPYPVVAGFLAGTGWLIIKGALTTMSDEPFLLSQASLFFKELELWRWMPGVMFGFLLLGLQRQVQRNYVFPIALLAGIALFHGLLWILDIRPEHATRLSLLLGGQSESVHWDLVSLNALSQVNWGQLLDHIDSLVSLLVIAAVALLLNASALELLSGHDADLNQELRAAGMANVVGGLAGGIVGFHSVSASGLAQGLGGITRAAGVIAALVCGLAILTGDLWLNLAPRPLVGGLLFFLGLSLVFDWLYLPLKHAQRAQQWGDALIVLAIVISIELFGFLESVSLGMFVALVMFVIDYAKVNVVRSSYTGAEVRSNVDRSIEEQQVLKVAGQSTLVLELHGYLFFGTSERLLEQVKSALREEKTMLRFLVLDFRRVTGMDSSALYSFQRIGQLARERGFTIALSAAHRAQCRRLDELGPPWQFMDDIDHALEWSEELYLEEVKGDSLPPVSLRNRLVEQLDDINLVNSLLMYINKRELHAGQVLIRTNTPVDALYLIETGSLDVIFEQGDKTIRIRTLGAGSVVGELGVYLGTRASASVVVVEAGSAWELSSESLLKLEAENPVLAVSFHKMMARLLGRRLLETNGSLRAISR